mmetsp:Transcript_73318/g.238624  ORF Transcript_73318/g.238624 Transcript_73318/m.238624 type:complete len:441 (+) Transcript_73318:404-1726(+)
MVLSAGGGHAGHNRGPRAGSSGSLKREDHAPRFTGLRVAHRHLFGTILLLPPLAHKLPSAAQATVQELEPQGLEVASEVEAPENATEFLGIQLLQEVLLARPAAEAAAPGVHQGRLERRLEVDLELKDGLLAGVPRELQGLVLARRTREAQDLHLLDGDQALPRGVQIPEEQRGCFLLLEAEHLAGTLELPRVALPRAVQVQSRVPSRVQVDKEDPQDLRELVKQLDGLRVELPELHEARVVVVQGDPQGLHVALEAHGPAGRAKLRELQPTVAIRVQLQAPGTHEVAVAQLEELPKSRQHRLGVALVLGQALCDELPGRLRVGHAPSHAQELDLLHCQVQVLLHVQMLEQLRHVAGVFELVAACGKELLLGDAAGTVGVEHPLEDVVQRPVVVLEKGPEVVEQSLRLRGHAPEGHVARVFAVQRLPQRLQLAAVADVLT